MELTYMLAVTTPAGPGKFKVKKGNAVSVIMDASGLIKTFDISEIRIPIDREFLEKSLKETQAVMSDVRSHLQPLIDKARALQELTDNNELDAGDKVLAVIRAVGEVVEAAGDTTENVLAVYPYVVKALKLVSDLLRSN